MGTNLHKIRFPVIARKLRVKSLLDSRKTKRFQVFFGHRFRHFLASNETIHNQFQTLCRHLHLMDSYSIDKRFTALLLVVMNQTPQIVDYFRIDLDPSLLDDINNKLNILMSSICNVLNEIDSNYLHQHKQNIGSFFENDSLTFRPNINSISEILAELLSRLLQTYSDQCKTKKVRINHDILFIFELYYHRNNHELIVRNLHTLLALTAGMGRFERTNAIVEYKPLMCLLFDQHTTDSIESIIVWKIVNGITKGFPENIQSLLELNVLAFLRKQLTSPNQPSYDVMKECLCILENICGNCRSDIQAVIDSDLIPVMINAFKIVDCDLREILLNSFYNISVLGSIDQLKVLLDLEIIQLLCYQLAYRVMVEEDISKTALEMMKNIFEEFYRKEHYAFHRILTLFNECGGQMTIKLLSNHTNVSISNVASEFAKYDNNTCTKCHQMATIESMMQQ